MQHRNAAQKNDQRNVDTIKMHRQTIGFIEVLRATACLLVVFTHVLAGRAEFYKYDWLPYRLLNSYLINPLGIIQAFGFFAVALFFIISGFIITHSVQRESRATFLVRRLFRIYPTLWFALAIALTCHWSDWWLTGQPNPTWLLSRWENVVSLTALNPLFSASGPVIVVWTLTIELFFYVYVLLLVPLIQRRPFAVCLAMIVASVAGSKAGVWLYPYFRNQIIGVMHEYLPVFSIGMAIYYGWSGRMKRSVILAVCAIAWCALVYNLRITQPYYLAYPTSYTIQIAYAIVLFLAVMWAMPNVEQNPRAVRFFSDISYSLYLIHYPVGVLTMDRLFPIIGFVPAAIISLAACIGLSTLSFAFVERPSQNIARRLCRSSQVRPPAEISQTRAVASHYISTEDSA